VGHRGISEKLAGALAQLGSQRVVLVHAEEGLDELGLSGPSHVTEYDAGRGTITTYTLSPEDVGLNVAPQGALAGGDLTENMEITRGILSGAQGPRRDATLLNAGAGIYAAGGAESIREGVEMAKDAIDSGKAMERLEHLAQRSRELKAAEMAELAVQA
jgi:anthranilate phosphoribosyltransferase